MAGRSQDKKVEGFKRDQKRETDYFTGYPKEGFGDRDEVNVPYKLEPSATAIEDFLTRLRQEGL